MKTSFSKNLILAAALAAALPAVSSAQTGRKEVLAIGKIEATAALKEDMQRKGRTVEMNRIIQALDGHFISALAGTRKFTLVGRSDLADLLKEQSLSDSGIVEATTAAEQGKVKGAKYRVVTSVDSFLEENAEREFPGTDRRGIKRRFQLSAQAKIYDATTAELLDAPNFQLEKIDTIIIEGQERSDAKRTDELMPKLALELAEKVAYGVVDFAFPAKVIDKEDKLVTINRGKGTGIREGEVWSVFGAQKIITDPDTGAVIKRKGAPMGKVRITSVDADSTQGEIIEDKGIAVGSVLNRPPQEAVVVGP